MKKIKTLFVRLFDEKHKPTVTTEVESGCEWVLNGEGKATRKYDGTCCLIKDGRIFKRYDFKPGRKLPNGAIPCQDAPDEITGHFPHWVECNPTNPADKYHISAFSKMVNVEDGTYELCGEHFQNNVDVMVQHGDVLIKHGETVLDVERTFEGIKNYLRDNAIEGIVFHRENGEMCKIKRSDFGFSWIKKGN
jgi:hypothetical protein